MKKILALTLVALFALTVAVSAAPGDDIALLTAGTKIIDKCGDGTGKGSGLAIVEALINGTSKTENVNGNKWWCNGDVTHTHPLVHTDPHYVIFDLGAEKSFDKIIIDLCGPESANFNAKEWDISVSNDNKTWVKIDEIKDNPSTNPIVTTEFKAPIKARYIKWTIYKAEQKDELGEIRMYGFSVLESAAAGTFPGGAAVTPTAPAQTTTKAGATGGDKAPDTGSMSILLLGVALFGSALVVYRLRKA